MIGKEEKNEFAELYGQADPVRASHVTAQEVG